MGMLKTEAADPAIARGNDGATSPADGLQAPGANEAELHLDLRGLHCPMPVLRARKALRGVSVGEAIVLDCTDPLTVIDMPHFAAEAGHTITAAAPADGLYRYRIVRRR